MLDSSNALERRKLVALLAGRGIPTTKIAAHLGVPISVIRDDRTRLSVTTGEFEPEDRSKRKKYQAMSREERLATNRLKLQPEVVAARRAAVPKLYAKGMTDTEIGKELGVTATTVARDRKLLGLPPLDFTKPTHDRRAEVLKLVENGAGMKEISRVLGVAPSTVTNDQKAILKDWVPLHVKAARNREVVRQRMAENVSLPDIAQELGVSINSVRRYKRTITEEDAAKNL